MANKANYIGLFQAKRVTIGIETFSHIQKTSSIQNGKLLTHLHMLESFYSITSYTAMTLQQKTFKNIVEQQKLLKGRDFNVKRSSNVFNADDNTNIIQVNIIFSEKTL